MRLHINHTIHFGVLLPLCFCGLLFGQPANGPIPGERCSAKTVVGTYAFANEGFVMMPAATPGVSLDLISIDHHGNISGRGVRSIGIVAVTDFDDFGTIQVNEDCTANITWLPLTRGSGAVVVLEGGKEMRSVGVGVLPLAWRGTWKRISPSPQPAECSTKSVHGVYAISGQGWIAPVPTVPSFVPAVSIGMLTIDRDGTVAGRGTFVLPMTPTPYEITDGEIEVQPDCTANFRMGWLSGRAIVLEQGDVLWGIQTAAVVGKPIISTLWTRIAKLTF